VKQYSWVTYDTFITTDSWLQFYSNTNSEKPAKPITFKAGQTAATQHSTEGQSVYLIAEQFALKKQNKNLLLLLPNCLLFNRPSATLQVTTDL